MIVSIRPPSSNSSSSLEAFGDRSKLAKDNWQHSHPIVQQLSQFSGKV